MDDKQSALAYIKWISKENGGRNPIPIGNRYNPLIVFEGQKEEDGSWSADIYVEKHIDDCTSIIRLSYLVEEAPFRFLIHGNKFSLFEGRRLVAQGIIINASNDEKDYNT